MKLATLMRLKYGARWVWIIITFPVFVALIPVATAVSLYNHCDVFPAAHKWTHALLFGHRWGRFEAGRGWPHWESCDFCGATRVVRPDLLVGTWVRNASGIPLMIVGAPERRENLLQGGTTLMWPCANAGGEGAGWWNLRMCDAIPTPASNSCGACWEIGLVFGNPRGYGLRCDTCIRHGF